MTFIDFIVIAMVVLVTVLAIAYYFKETKIMQKVINMVFGKKPKKQEEDMELIEDDLNQPDKTLVKQTKEMMGIRQPDEAEAEMPPTPPKAPTPEPKKSVVVAQIFKDENDNLGIAFGEHFNLVQFHSFIVPFAKAIEEGFVQDHIANLKKAFNVE